MHTHTHTHTHNTHTHTHTHTYPVLHAKTPQPSIITMLATIFSSKVRAEISP